MIPAGPGRRPLATRQARWAQRFARFLAAVPVAPNHISGASLGAALAAGGCFALSPQAATSQGQSMLLIIAAVCIQGRLLCNMFDGMVAVEGGLRSPTGEMWNEVPDRFADGFMLVGAGYAAAGTWHGLELGYAATAGALLTAYIRALGASLGCPGLFHGPMAKPQRMALLTAAALGAACVPSQSVVILSGALALVVLGTALTTWRRLRALRQHVESPCLPS